MLAKFRAAKAAEIEALRKDASLLPEPRKIARPPFAAALGNGERIAVIAEYKRASPSLGIIRTDLEIEDVARAYANGGAAALSVLTEESFFNGSLGYLDRAAKTCELPLLRKDFIFDELQVRATAATSASAILLIARMLPDSCALRKMRELAESCGLDDVIEIFDERDLALAREAGARLIQVNSRDLQTLQVDSGRLLRLAALARPESHETWIAASGFNSPAQLRRAHEAGYHAALVGSYLMARGAPDANLGYLLAGSR